MAPTLAVLGLLDILRLILAMFLTSQSYNFDAIAHVFGKFEIFIERSRGRTVLRGTILPVQFELYSPLGNMRTSSDHP